ncbi:hypothetical protein ACOME3_000118 [Neoechinorhynchus agilis]
MLHLHMLISRLISKSALQQTLRTSLLRSSSSSFGINPTAFMSTNVFDRQRSGLLEQSLKMQALAFGQPKAAASGSVVPANVKWSIERIVSLDIALLIPAIFIFPSKALEATLVALIVTHAHWGMQHIIADYVPNKLQKSFLTSLYGLSGLALAGFVYFIYNDVGIADALKQVWAI